jgi:N-acetylmuramic acid 6-phosphate etherase
MSQLSHLTTESRNPASENLDEMSATELVQLMNSEDAKISAAIATQTAPIAKAVEAIAERMKRGGRLIYIGAGTSGRMGVLDASECPPTFNSDPAQVVGLIAGGDTALRTAIEGAEDHPEYAEADLKEANLSEMDVLVGIAASGRTPYVVGGLRFAQSIGAVAVGFTCNEKNELRDVSDILICPVVGPEVLSGSTRMKAGTATKLVLNMLTTGAMVLLGKTYGNLMVDLQATNSKLIDRSARIVCEMTDLSRPEAESLLEQCDGQLKVAIVAELKQLDASQARQLLTESNGQLRVALK